MSQQDPKFSVKTLKNKFTNKKTSECRVSFYNASDLVMPKANHSGSLRLDINLGIPFPAGRIIEIYGNPGSGKTTVSLAIADQAVANGNSCLFIDQERRLSRGLVETFKNLSASPEQFVVAKTDSGDDALILAREWAQLNPGSIIIIDSVDALVPKRIEGKEIGEADVGSLPKLMSDGCRKIKDACDKSGSTVIFLNQLRSNIGGYGPADTTSGGRALGFYASQRIQLKDNAKSYQIKDDDGRVIGHNVRFFIAKNSYAVPYVDGEFPLIYGKGFDSSSELFDLAASLAFIESAGNYYLLDEKKLPRKTYIDKMRADPELFAKILKEVKEAFPETFGEEGIIKND